MGSDTVKLSVCALGVACGILWGISLLFLSYLSLWCDIGTPIVAMLGSLYLGFAASITGGLIGLLWGLLDGFIAGVIFAWLYNCCLCYCPCFSCKVTNKDQK